MKLDKKTFVLIASLALNILGGAGLIPPPFLEGAREVFCPGESPEAPPAASPDAGVSQ